MEYFGKKLKLVRTNKNLSQADLSRIIQERFATKITVKTISNYEINAREPNLQNLKLLALALNTPIDYFFDTMDLRLNLDNDDQTPKIKLLSNLKRELNKFEDI